MGHFCCDNDFTNQLEEDVFTQEEQDEYTLMVFLGIISVTNPSPNYTFRVLSVFERALIDGFGSTIHDLTPGTPEHTLFKSFRESLLSFTEAKQTQQIKEMSQFLGLDQEDFMIEGGKVFNKFNSQYLSAEYETTINASKSGARWVEFEKNKVSKPMLTYRTQRDNRVRPEHRILEGITRPVDDPFWDLYYPPNGWNCRCYTVSSSSAVLTTDIPINEISSEIPDLFKFNPGKTGFVFSPSHPYYKGVSRSVRELV